MAMIYGASDDLVEIEGLDGGDEVNCMGGGCRVTLGSRETGGRVVTMRYLAGAVWSAEVGQLGEGITIPWGVSLATHHANDRKPVSEHYSVAVLVDCPRDTPVTWKKLSVKRCPPRRRRAARSPSDAVRCFAGVAFTGCS